MDYKAKECSICGSNKLKLVSHNCEGENVFYTYRCESCRAVFSTQTTYKKRIEIEKQQESRKQRLQEQSQKQSVGNQNSTYLKELSATEVYKQNRSSVVEMISEFGDMFLYGTGTVLGDGYILSNAHTVAKTKDGKIVGLARSIECFDENGLSHYAKIVDIDAANDLSLLFVSEITAKGVELSNIPVETGDRVYSIGNTKGEGICLCEGIVSDKQRFVLDRNVIMIAAPVTNGNSGGPIFNVKGKVIGIVTFGRTDSTAMNFAIPVITITAFLKRNLHKQ